MRRPLFVLTIALNAALLFAVEPMVSKRVLPLFGGTPSVWNTCLMAFQALLLVGYLYAHTIARRLSGRGQIAMHLGLFAVSLGTLPPVLHGSAPPPGWPPAAWLLMLLLGAVGAPFVVLSAGAPLLQRWYTAAPDGGEPYFLYAASNVGSMLALIGYPLLMEPTLGLASQAYVWAWCYAALGIALAACAWTARDVPATPPAAVVHAPWRDRLLWGALAFVPSSLLLGVTRYLTTDVAPVPLLWVIPLALYLLTFVMAFAERWRVPNATLEPAFAAAIPMLAMLSALGVNKPLWVIAGMHVFAVAVASLACHQALADRRPPASGLTEFYLWVSLGGLAGGVFNALIAPVAFDSLAEYPIAMGLAAAAWAAAARPAEPAPTIPRRFFARLAGDERGDDTRSERWVWHLAAPLVAGALMFAAIALRGEVPSTLRATLTTALGVPAVLLAFALRRRRWAYALGVAALLAGAHGGQRLRGGNILAESRSFFGTYTVRSTGPYHHLQNGTTLHGAQNSTPQHRTTPLTYYHERGPLGAVFAALPAHDDRARRVAAVGLGAGTIACYGKTGEQWTFYEIDPLIVRIARDPRLFTYLRDCPPHSDVVVGDARLRLADAPAGAFDAVILDAFSSDAIPTHLLTREAIGLYESRLAPDGLLLVHVSNRYVDLVPVLAELARDRRLAGAYGSDVSGVATRNTMLSASTWVVLARRASSLASITRAKGWAPLPPTGDVGVWTDDFTDVLSVVKWH